MKTWVQVRDAWHFASVSKSQGAEDQVSSVPETLLWLQRTDVPPFFLPSFSHSPLCCSSCSHWLKAQLLLLLFTVLLFVFCFFPSIRFRQMQSINFVCVCVWSGYCISLVSTSDSTVSWYSHALPLFISFTLFFCTSCVVPLTVFPFWTWCRFFTSADCSAAILFWGGNSVFSEPNEGCLFM